MLLIALLSAVSFSAYRTLAQQENDIRQSQMVFHQKQEALNDYLQLVLRRQSLMRDIISEQDPFARDAIIMQEKNNAGRATTKQRLILALAADEKERQLVRATLNHSALGYQSQQEIIDIAISENADLARKRLLHTHTPLFNAIIDSAAILSDYQKQQYALYVAASSRQIAATEQRILWMYAVAILFSIFAAWLLLRRYQQQSQLNQRLAVATENSPEILITFDEDLKPRYVNARGRAFLQTHDIPFKQTLRIMPGNFSQMAKSAMQHNQGSSNIRHSYSDTRWQISLSPIAGQKLLHCHLTDVTALTEVADALYREKEHAEITLNAIADGVITINANGNVNQTAALTMNTGTTASFRAGTGSINLGAAANDFDVVELSSSNTVSIGERFL